MRQDYTEHTIYSKSHSNSFICTLPTRRWDTEPLKGPAQHQSNEQRNKAANSGFLAA